MRARAAAARGREAGEQLGLFSLSDVRFDAELAGLRRWDLGGPREDAWVELLPGWLEGDGKLLADLVETTRWRARDRVMYDRLVEVPRLYAMLPADGPIPDVLARAARLLALRYGAPYDRIGLNLYRDGADGVAMHADDLPAPWRDAPLPILSLGAPRRFVLRPRGRRGETRAWCLGAGDLLVLGGAALREWEHGVPKVPRAGRRVSVMFRTSARSLSHG